jgi:hypothetical protein
VTIPYGTRIAVRTAPRPTRAQRMIRASPMPRTSSTATDTTEMNTVTPNAVHHRRLLSTVA